MTQCCAAEPKLFNFGSGDDSGPNFIVTGTCVYKTKQALSTVVGRYFVFLRKMQLEQKWLILAQA